MFISSKVSKTEVITSAPHKTSPRELNVTTREDQHIQNPKGPGSLYFAKNTLIGPVQPDGKKRSSQEKAKNTLNIWLERPVFHDGKVASSSLVTPAISNIKGLES